MGLTNKQTKVFYLKRDTSVTIVSDNFSRFTIRRLVNPIRPEHYIKYYRLVGEHFNWHDRTMMPESELFALINSPSAHIYVAHIDGQEAGYFELIEVDTYIELLYFGLFPAFIGKGFGKAFLQQCIQKALTFNPSHLQLNTCELDHPNALPLYMAVGFQQYKQTIEDRYINDNQ